MTCPTSVDSRFTGNVPSISSLILSIAKLWHHLAVATRDAYRPELHYMRGPGPRWRAKHQASPQHGAGRLLARDLTSNTELDAPGMRLPLPARYVRGRPASSGRPQFPTLLNESERKPAL